MTIITNPGRDEVQAVFLRSALKLSQKGIMPSKGLTKKKLMSLASHITGNTYKRGQLDNAIYDLTSVIDANKGNIYNQKGLLMPNHCDQQVTLSGTLDLMREIHEELFKSSKEGFEPQLLQLILPMPFNMNKSTKDENGNYNAGWYDWRVLNWGCKWDVADVEI